MPPLGFFGFRWDQTANLEKAQKNYPRIFQIMSISSLPACELDCCNCVCLGVSLRPAEPSKAKKGRSVGGKCSPGFVEVWALVWG